MASPSCRSSRRRSCSRFSSISAEETPALTRTAPGAPPAAVLRTALYRFALSPPRAPAADPAAARIPDRAQGASLPVARLADPAILRRALDAVTFRLDGSRAAATTIARKHAILHGALSHAVEAGLLKDNPAGHISWHPPKAATAIDPQSRRQPRPGPDTARRPHPDQAAFFGCMYYAALRPEEAVALRLADCSLPCHGWGQLTMNRAAPSTGAAWTSTGTTNCALHLVQVVSGSERGEPRGQDVRYFGRHLATRPVPLVHLGSTSDNAAARRATVVRHHPRPATS